DPRREDRALILGEPVDQAAHALGGEAAESFLLDISRGGPSEDGLVGRWVRGVTPLVTPLVDQSVMRDGQNPRPEFSLFPPEGGEVAGNLEEHLAGQVLGLAGAPAPQVPEHEWSNVTVQGRPRPLGSTQGGLEHLGEALAQTQLD